MYRTKYATIYLYLHFYFPEQIKKLIVLFICNDQIMCRTANNPLFCTQRSIHKKHIAHSNNCPSKSLTIGEVQIIVLFNFIFLTMNINSSTVNEQIFVSSCNFLLQTHSNTYIMVLPFAIYRFHRQKRLLIASFKYSELKWHAQISKSKNLDGPRLSDS